MYERRDVYLLWARHPPAARAGPEPHLRALAAVRRPERRRGAGPIPRLWRLASLRPRRRSPGARPRDELDIHAYLELEFAVEDEQRPAGQGRR